jgi:hypothetical protein
LEHLKLESQKLAKTNKRTWFMKQREKERLRARLKWVSLYESTKNSSVPQVWNFAPNASKMAETLCNCKIPGERVQIDVCKIAAGIYQYTAIDDCTRYKVLAIYNRRTAKNTLDFIENQVFLSHAFSSSTK